MYFAVIVHPDKVQRATLKHCLQESTRIELTEFASDTKALEKLESDPRHVDFLFTHWELSQDKNALLKRFRQLPQGQNTLVFMVASAEDEQWIAPFFHIEGIIEAVLGKPLRPPHLLRTVQQLMTTDPLAKPCTLLVEDDRIVREVVRDYLLSFGATKVVEASNGVEAIQALEKSAGDISMVVSDWQMPGMTGIELLSRIRKTPRWSTIPFVIITTHTPDTPVKTIKAAEMGADGYLMKPFNLRTFHSQMEVILQESSKHRNAQAYLVVGRALIGLGEHFQAEKVLGDGMKIFPGNPLLLEAQGDSFALREGDTKGLPSAADLYEKALKLNPLNLPLVMKGFEVYSALGRMNEAVRILRGQLRRSESEDVLRIKLGKIYLENGDYASALTELSRALALNPASSEAQALHQLATSWTRTRKAA